MKHDLRVILALIFLFLVSQFAGLAILYEDMEVVVAPTGEINVTHSETVLGPRPEVSGPESFIMIIGSVLVGTLLLLLLIRFGKVNIWKTMFFLAVFMTISVALGVIIDPLAAVLIAFLLAVFKILKPSIIIHNFTEILMYAGIAVLFVPLFDITWIIALLLVISAYDIFAVFQSKHMITMAKFQTKSKVFSGLFIPYVRKSKKQGKKAEQSEIKGKKVRVTEAILGGGDIAFPLMFAGVVMEGLINAGMLTKELALLKTLIIPVIVSIALLFLFMKAREGKYYPAMPVLTAGCLIGLAIAWLI